MAEKKKRSVNQQTARARLSPAALFFTLGGGAVIAALAGACVLWIVLDPGGRLVAEAASSATAGAGLRYLWGCGALLALVLLVIVQWRLLRPSTVPVRIAAAPDAARTPEPSPKAAALLREQRIFVYLLSRLQREGRLMDFLAEDLEAYEDGQIGAAVRSVHAGCRRVVEKMLAPKPAMDQPEDAQVILDADYDPHLVTLTGHVGDHPPFQGVVRHAGWRASRIDIPLLAEETDPTIIAPAEVEVR